MRSWSPLIGVRITPSMRSRADASGGEGAAGESAQEGGAAVQRPAEQAGAARAAVRRWQQQVKSAQAALRAAQAAPQKAAADFSLQQIP